MSDYKLIKAQTILTMNPENEVIEDGLLVMKGDRIEALGKWADLESQYVKEDSQVLDYPHGILMPGLVTTHTHLFQRLMIGIGSNLCLDDWVTKVIFPLGLAMGREETYVSAKLNMLEMLRTGTTCFADSHYMVQEKDSIDGVADAIEETGIRGMIVRATQEYKFHPDVPDEVLESETEALAQTEAFIQKYKNHASDRIRVGIEPICILDCSQSLVKGLHDLAEKYDIRFQTHIAETFGELTTIKNQYGMGTIEYLDSIGALSDRTMLIHSVWINANEKVLIKERGASVAHNPVANMILGDGVAPIPDLRASGVTVGIGVDGAASNNNQDMFEAMKSCALLHRVNQLDAGVLDAIDVLRMSTIESAKALGWDDEIGSLEVGKKADAIVLDQNTLNLSPSTNPISNIVFTGNGRDVDTTIVDGKVLLYKGDFVEHELETFLEKARQTAFKMMDQAGIDKDGKKRMA